MLKPVNRLKYKVFTSFAIAVCASLGIMRLGLQTHASSQGVIVYVILGVLAIAGVWRGVIYLRAVNALPADRA
ncbi:MAG TPA: hypothetical protein VJN22_02695 [Candidatus Eremiobacteraceae bacterium]|nr:hypothetical protein [Candidatus Eremiobacteraceae bacterium]